MSARPPLPGLLAALLCGGLLISRPAGAQDYAAAGRSFAAAQDAFAQGNYQKAAEGYQAAYAITSDPALLFNIGESYQRAGDGARALATYRAYLKAQPDASDRAEVERRITALEAGAGAAPPAGAASGTAPPDKGPALRTVAPKDKDPVARPAAEPGAGPYRFAAWTSVAASVALLTAGGILGLGAQNRADELERRTNLVTGGQPAIYDDAQREAYTSLVSEGRAYNAAAITCFAVAGAAALTSGILFLVDWRRRPAERRPVAGLAPRGTGTLRTVWSF